MGLAYRDLDNETRRLMAEEIRSDIEGRGLYISSYCSPVGVYIWPKLISEAALSGSDDTLAHMLAQNQCFLSHVQRRKPSGGFTTASVPYTAPQTLAESQFNMYYMRALFRRSQNENRPVVVYRAKAVENPRAESERLIGTTLDPDHGLEVLRRTKGVEPEIGIPMPNSGLSVHLG